MVFLCQNYGKLKNKPRDVIGTMQATLTKINYLLLALLIINPNLHLLRKF